MLTSAPVNAVHANAAADKDIVDTAVGAGSFKALVAAVKAAGLVETLKGKGPFMVFRQPMKHSQNCRREPSTRC